MNLAIDSPGPLVLGGRFFGQCMHAAVNVGVRTAIERIHGGQ